MSEEKESIPTDSEETSSDSAGGESAASKGAWGLDLERLLNPIPGDNPAGEPLRYEGTYDRIQEAREEDADLPQGVWERELKKADWKGVRGLCLEALESRSKDIQIGVWLLEALLHLHGFEGLREGMKLLMGLCEGFWDHLYPEIEEDDFESRVSPFIWMNEKLYLKLKTVRITQPDTVDAVPYTWADWESAGHLEKLALREKNLLQDAEAKGKITRAKFLGSVMFTPKSFYQSQSQYLLTAVEIANQLGHFLDERCGKQSPSLAQFREAMEGIQRLLNDFLLEKRGEDEGEETPPLEGDQQDEFAAEEEGKVVGKRYGIGTIRNRGEAYRMLSAAADYLLIHEPHSPTPYLVKRAVSWGNMTLTELLHELVTDEHDLVQIYKLLGIKGPPMM
jgi:type VI secretion system protein ImpA